MSEATDGPAGSAHHDHDRPTEAAETGGIPMDTEHRTTNRRTSMLISALVVAAVVLASMVVGTSAAEATPAPRPLTPAQQGVKDALNRDRQLRGLRALPTQRDAQAKAQAWANRLASEGRLYHSTLRDGIRTRYCSLGENIGFGNSTQAVQVAYMGSAIHRRNILDRKWNGVGVGYAKRGNAVYTVQVFITSC